MMKDNVALVLAAGKGTRMKSKKPKVLNTLAGRPMLFYTLEKLNQAGVPKIIVVIGYRGSLVKRAVKEGVAFAEKIDFAVQPEQGGTGDALRWGMKDLEDSNSIENVIVVNGDDSAFYNPQTVKKILEMHNEADCVVTFVSILKDDPTGFGRVIKDKSGKVTDIVEEKDADTAQRKIKEINAGFYIFDFNWLKKNIYKLQKNKSGEYYIVDLVKIAADQKNKVSVYKLDDNRQWYGVNTREQLLEADKRMKSEID